MRPHFHGTPIWGNAGDVLRVAVSGAGAFVSYVRPDQIERCFKYADSVAIDNGAFSAWKSGKKLDWNKFYEFLHRHYHRAKLAFFCIPDVVEGGESDNDAMIKAVPHIFKDKAAPVWHLHESIERLVRLCEEWPRVCFGSSGQYAATLTKHWHERMNEAFTEIYIKRQLTTKIHGLRMLDGRILGNYPLHSADSTNLACNVPKFNVKYPELTRAVLDKGYGQGMVQLHRCAILKNSIESVTPPSIAVWVAAQEQK